MRCSFLKSTSWLMVLSLAFFGELSAKDRVSRAAADSLNIKGEQMLAMRQFQPARNFFKKVYDTFPDDVTALLGLGDADFQEQNWGDADNWYDKVLDKDSNNLAAHYGKAISKREVGKNAVLLQRALIWRSARKHFRRTVELDSTYKDALFQWAIMERFDRNFKEAILLAHRQLRMQRTTEVQLGLLKMYDYFLAHTPREKAEAWLASRNTEYDRYALGELFRRRQDFARADSIFQMLIPRPARLPIQAPLLSRVRLLIQTDRPREAEAAYWRAVDQIRDGAGVEVILQDFITIIHDPEYRMLENQITLKNFPEAMRQFWANRDPLPAAPVNERLIEHFRRTVYAEENFRYDGFRHKLNVIDKNVVLDRPIWLLENYKFTDQGLVYIRYGEPDEKSFSVSEGIDENMSWLYYPRGENPKLIFHFTIYPNAPPGLWTLVSGFQDKQILEGMMHWDQVYQELMMATEDNEFMARWHELITARAEMARIGLRLDRHTWPKETRLLDMVQTTYRYRESPDRDVLKIAYAIPLSTLREAVTDFSRLETGIAVFDKTMKPIFKTDSVSPVPDSSDAHIHHGYYIDAFTVPVTPDTHNIALHARLRDASKLNAWKYQYPISRANRDGLALSSLELAYDIRPDSIADARNRKDLTIVPNPSERFEKSDPVFAYYEGYNLAYDESGRTRYEVDFTLRADRSKASVFNKLFGWIGGGGGYKISLHNEQTGDSRTATDYLSFDVSQAGAGKYELLLVVKDLVTGDKAEARAGFELE